MQRDVIVDLGKTGFGKTLWSRVFLTKVKRKFIYDPLQSIETRYVTKEEIQEALSDETYLDVRQDEAFSYGIYDKDLLPIFADLAHTLTNCFLVVEECSTVFDKGQRNLPEWMRRLVFQGRHRSVSLLFIAQRAVSIPIDIRSQANRIVTFQQHEDDDLGWLIGFFGKDKTAQMPFLPKLQCYDYLNGQVTSYSIRQQVKKTLGITIQKQESEYVYL